MAYLDDQNGRPVQQKFLDLVSLKPLSKEEIHSALHKIPEMKLRPEKIPEEENVVKPQSWKNLKDFPYLDAVPSCMRHVDIRELSTVNIDWKMLTLDRPETALDIQIFSRMVYLDKLMLKCVVEEKEKKAREKYIRLRTKGRPKPPADSDVDKSDEFTYDYFSRFSGGIERAQAMEEVPKSATEDKSRPPTSADVQEVNKTPVPPTTRIAKKFPVKKKLKKKRRKKKRKKGKLRKRKLATKTKLKVGQNVRKFIPPLRKPKKSKTIVIPKKKVANLGSRVKKKSDTNKTLVQILKASEAQDRRERRKDSNKKSEV